jgi:hypothetical protein
VRREIAYEMSPYKRMAAAAPSRVLISKWNAAIDSWAWNKGR